MNATEPWTVGRLLTWTADYLKQHGSPSARLDAEVLLAEVRGCKRIELYTAFDDEPDDETKAAFRSMVKSRSEGTPVAYLVGHKEFYSMDFKVTSDVLIPRPETEHLVVAALDMAAAIYESKQRPLRIVDVGTGSGAIAISVAKHFEHCQVTGIDVSPVALEVARGNADSHELDASRVSFVEGDLLSGLDANEKFDLILSNPPYVSQAEYAELDVSVRDYEPELALVGGVEGYELIVKLLEQCKSRLEPGGAVLIEFSPMLAERLEQFVTSAWEVEITKDFASNARMITLKLVE